MSRWPFACLTLPIAAWPAVATDVEPSGAEVNEDRPGWLSMLFPSDAARSADQDARAAAMLAARRALAEEPRPFEPGARAAAEPMPLVVPPTADASAARRTLLALASPDRAARLHAALQRGDEAERRSTAPDADDSLPVEASTTGVGQTSGFLWSAAPGASAEARWDAAGSGDVLDLECTRVEAWRTTARPLSAPSQRWCEVQVSYEYGGTSGDIRLVVRREAASSRGDLVDHAAVDLPANEGVDVPFRFLFTCPRERSQQLCLRYESRRDAEPFLYAQASLGSGAS